VYTFKDTILWRIKDYMVHDFLKMGVVGKSAHGNRGGICWLAGGALRGLVDKHDQLVDFDLFFSNALRAAEVGLDLEDRGFKMVFRCPRGELTTYVSPKPEPDFANLAISDGRQMKVQLVTKMFYPNVETMLHTFDINACRFAYDGENVYTDREALRSAKKREVTLHKVMYPNATFKRMMKYRDKGYRVTNEAVDFFTQSVYDMGMIEATLNREFYVD
jgi:hypothetical protein